MKRQSQLIAGSFSLALLLLGGVGIASFSSVQRLVDDKQWVSHTHEVLRAVDEVDRGLLASENSRRGYLLTKNPNYLKTLKRAITQTQASLEQVRVLSQDNARQQQRLNQLEPLVEQRLALLRQSVQTFQQHPANLDEQIAQIDRGTVLREQAQTLLQAINDEEEALLQWRETDTNYSLNRVILVVTLGYGVGLGLLLWVFFLLRRQIQENQRLAEEALRLEQQAARARLGDILESITTAFIVLDRSWRYTYVNQPAEQLLGLSASELLGRVMWDVFPDCVTDPIHPILHEVMADRQPRQIENFYAPWNCWFEQSLYPWEDGLSLFFRDITDRKQTAIALERSENRYRSLIEATTQIVWKTKGDGQVIEDLPDWCKVTGQTEAEVRGWGWLQAIHPDDREYTLHLWQQAIAQKQFYKIEHRVQTPNGSYRVFLGRGVPILDADGEILEWVGTHTDITDRVLAQEALQKSARELSDLYNGAPCGYHSVDADGGFVRINDMGLKIFGYSRSELVGKRRFSDLLTPASLLTFQNSFPMFKERGWVRDLEFDVVRKDGTVFPISLSATAVFDRDGHFLMSRSVVLDISDRRHAEAELRESEIRFRSAFEQAAVGIAYVSTQGNWLRVNQKLCDIVGYSRAELLELTFQDITHADDLTTDLAFMQQMLAGEIQTYSMEKRYLRKTGELVWINLTASLVRHEDDTPNYFISVVEDISDRRQVELALRKSQGQLQQIFDNTPAMIYLKDLQGRFMFVNRPLERLLQWERSQLLGRTDRDIFTPELAEQFLENDRQVLASGKALNLEELAPHADGLRTYLSQKFPLFDLDGNPYATCGFSIDITDLKRAQADLKEANETLELRVADRTAELEHANAELARSNQELEQFAYVASHDLQEPLRAISGYTQLLQLDYEDTFDAGGRESLHYILDGSSRMRQLIQDLLAYSRAGTRNQVVPVDCTEALRVALLNLDRTIAETNASTTHTPLPVIQGDKTQLIQLFQNLVGNAIKFHRPGELPHVAIGVIDAGPATCDRFDCDNSACDNSAASPQVSLKPQPSKDYTFYVRDNGIGIKPQYLDRIFEVFRRLHTRREFPGTGIGLAICKKIVERHGGQIWAESELNVGTTFYFTLPRSVPPSD